MGSLKVLAVAGAVVIGAASTALAGDLPAPPPPAFDAPLRGTVSASGLYLRGDIGVGAGRVGKYSNDDLAAVPDAVFVGGKHPTPAFVGAGIGYKFNSWLRADLTGEYRAKSAIGATDRFTNPFLVPPGPQTNTYNGQMSSLVFLANAYVDLGTFCAFACLTPFVGAGIGFTQNSITGLVDQGVQQPGGVGPAFPTLGYAGTGTKTNLAWAIHAGVGYQITDKLTLELGYRYLNLGKAQSGGLINPFLPGPPQAPLKLSSIDSHDIKIGMRWALNGDCCQAPAPVYAPPPMIRKF